MTNSIYLLNAPRVHNVFRASIASKFDLKTPESTNPWSVQVYSRFSNPSGPDVIITRLVSRIVQKMSRGV